MKVTLTQEQYDALPLKEEVGQTYDAFYKNLRQPNIVFKWKGSPGRTAWWAYTVVIEE